MQEFLTNNTVNCNLMSLTGYRTLVLLNTLMESPKSIEEINNCFYENQYIKEKFSTDTLRIYINSLRAVGCDISRANKTNSNKYELISHPFDFDINSPQLKALSRFYNNIYDKIDIDQLIDIENLFIKISEYIKNEKTKTFLKNVSMLKNMDKSVLHELIIHCKKKNQITFLYKSPRSGKKEIEIIAEKLYFKSEKLYLLGQSITHGENAYYRADRILELSTIKLKKDKKETTKTKVIFELYNQRDEYIPDDNEKIIEKFDDKIIIEATSENKFSLLQNILYKAQDCKVISPANFQKELVSTLKSMKENYH